MSSMVTTMMNVCKCGCGEQISDYRTDGFPKYYVQGHNERGKKHSYIVNKIGKEHYNWKGGQRINSTGYVVIRSVGHPRAISHGHYVSEHTLIMEKKIGRYLKDDEVVHHINHNKQDNRIENLQLMTKAEHTRLHRKRTFYRMNYDPKPFIAFCERLNIMELV